MINLNVIALDEDFEIYSYLSPHVIQWNRKYYDFGDFELNIPVNQYHEDIKYIYLEGHDELGIVQKKQYYVSDNEELINLSGFFIEKILDDKITYPMYNGRNKCEYIARDIVTTYKDDIPLYFEEYHSLGETISLQSTGDNLGSKIFEIFKPQELSYKIKYNFTDSKLYFDTYQGLDRTQSQAVNNYVVFNTVYSGVVDYNINIDNSNYKNYAIIGGQGEGTQRIYETLDISNGGYKYKIFVDARDLAQDEMTLAEYKQILADRGLEKLQEYKIINNYSINVLPESYKYKNDYDLGDKVDVVINNLGISIQCRIIAIYEVYKDNQQIIEIELN